MSTTFLSLQNEVLARGADYLDTTTDIARVKSWLNNAYTDICGRQPWPFLEVTLSNQNAPLSLTDLRAILSVVDETSLVPLEGIDRRDLSKVFMDLTQTGFDVYWYLEGGTDGAGGQQDTLKIYPVNASDSLEVRYVKVAPALAADTDVPLLPDRFTYSIVDGAMVFVHHDNDDYDLAAQASQAFEQGIQRMAAELLDRNFMNAQRQFISQPPWEFNA